VSNPPPRAPADTARDPDPKLGPAHGPAGRGTPPSGTGERHGASGLVAGRARSVGHALRGVATMLRTEPNARLHAAATLAVSATGLALPLTRHDWCWLVVAIASVWTAEALNTAIERVADVAHPGEHPTIGRAKDVAAGGVLVAAIAAAAIGALVLGPPLWDALAGA
jgi:diacylglycerol kinase